MFNKRRRHSIIITRAIGEMEQVQVTMTSDDSAEFAKLLQDAEAAIQVRADEFQQQLKEAAEARAAEVKSKKGN